MDLCDLINNIADAILIIDKSRIPFRTFQPGVGPYGEPQLLKLVASNLNNIPQLKGKVRTMRTPDLLVSGDWAMEFKIARPFEDNGKEAENWSVNLLHPYTGNVSTIGDCFKLKNLSRIERKAIVVIGYEHIPPIINLDPLVNSFEVIAEQIMDFRLSKRIEIRRNNLIHPIHQSVRVFAWELLQESAYFYNV